MLHESAVMWHFFVLCFVAQSSHIPMIDALMMAYTVEMISIEKVVSCVKRFSTFSASKELPFDLEDAMIFWINKVCFFFFFWGVWPLVKSCLYWNCPWCIRFTCFLTEHSLNGEISVWIDILLHVLIAYLHLSSAWPDHVHSCKHEDLCQHF